MILQNKINLNCTDIKQCGTINAKMKGLETSFVLPSVLFFGGGSDGGGGVGGWVWVCVHASAHTQTLTNKKNERKHWKGTFCAHSVCVNFTMMINGNNWN